MNSITTAALRLKLLQLYIDALPSFEGQKELVASWHAMYAIEEKAYAAAKEAKRALHIEIVDKRSQAELLVILNVAITAFLKDRLAPLLNKNDHTEAQHLLCQGLLKNNIASRLKSGALKWNKYDSFEDNHYANGKFHIRDTKNGGNYDIEDVPENIQSLIQVIIGHRTIQRANKEERWEFLFQTISNKNGFGERMDAYKKIIEASSIRIFGVATGIRDERRKTATAVAESPDPAVRKRGLDGLQHSPGASEIYYTPGINDGKESPTEDIVTADMAGLTIESEDEEEDECESEDEEE